MDKIFIQDLLVRGIIGINEWERENPQDILINIYLSVNLNVAGLSDNIDDSINYRTLSKEVITLAEKTKRYTVEALAEDIATLCLSDSRIEKVRVRVEKPGAVRFTKSVGVEIERCKRA